MASCSRACTKMRSTRRTSMRPTSRARLQAASEALRGIALSQANELVALPDLGPGQWTVEQPLSEFGHSRTVLGGRVF